VDIEFVDPTEVPRDPENVRFLEIQFQILPDGRRVNLTIETSSFTQPPDIDIVAHAPDGREVASTAIIGAPNKKMSLTLHLRGKLESGSYPLSLFLKYQDVGIVDKKELILQIPD
jgi:hypothetical protein